MEKDLKQATDWYRKSAEQGYAPAQWNLGLCYKYGNGVEKDLKQAAEWYRKAAEQGDADAQFSLGVCYEAGIGVKEDPKQALEWYQKAAAQGVADAHYKIGEYYYAKMGGKDGLMAAGVLLTAAMAVPVTNFVTIPAAAAIGIGRRHFQDNKIREFLKSEDGKKMMRNYQFAAAEGSKDAEKRLKELNKYL